MGVPVSDSPVACRSCRTRDCCYDREVAINADEVATLARTLAVAPERFATLAPAQDLDPNAIKLAADAPERWRMVLRRRPDGAGRTRCVFLVTSGAGRPVCGAGELAPSACKAFPAPFVTGAATRVAGCWRTWSPEEVTAIERPDETRAKAAVMRWNQRVAERRFPLPESAFLHALLADPEVGASVAAESAQGSPGASAARPSFDALPEASSSSGCSTCTTSRCCVMFDPEITGADLLRLMRGVGLEPRDIAELKPTRKDQAGDDAIHLGDERAWDLRLRRTAALAGTQGPGGTRRCGFLVDLTHPEMLPASRCGVYEHRPLVCRLFPSDLTSFGVMVGTPEAVCPPQAWSQERADLPTLHHLHLVARHERERFRVFIAAWNPASEALVGAAHDARSAAFMAALVAFERRVRERPDDDVATLAAACVSAETVKTPQPSK